MYDRIIVALGNPGKKYDWTRHNFGFIALDLFLQEQSITESFKSHPKAQADVLDLVIESKRILFIKPTTFMNDSGKAVRQLLDFYKESVDKVVLIHDELDLPFGEVKISKDRGAAGHNGVQSVFDHLHTKDITRLRLGISTKKRLKIPTEKYVLLPFSFWEKRKIHAWSEKLAQSLLDLIKE